jgi:hypothetical protein
MRWVALWKTLDCELNAVGMRSMQEKNCIGGRKRGSFLRHIEKR